MECLSSMPKYRVTTVSEDPDCQQKLSLKKCFGQLKHGTLQDAIKWLFKIFNLLLIHILLKKLFLISYLSKNFIKIFHVLIIRVSIYQITFESCKRIVQVVNIY